MKRLSFSNIVSIPTVYVADDKEDEYILRDAGVPYVVRPKGFDDFAITFMMFAKYLVDEYPWIDWKEVFYKKTGKYMLDSINIMVPAGDHAGEAHQSGDSDMADVASDTREFTGSIEDDYHERSLQEWFGDQNAYVDIDKLRSLSLLPPFMSEISQAIRKQDFGYEWMDGYDKKKGLNVGTFNGANECDNLIIFDVSGSIPRGISATTLAMAASLKADLNAHVIVTGSKSMYWHKNDDLPDPKWIRDHIGFANERDDFIKILKTHIDGKEWGNVVVFGDNDWPGNMSKPVPFKQGTMVHKLLSFHTWQDYTTPGYARFIHECELEAPDFEETFDTDWCSVVFT